MNIVLCGMMGAGKTSVGIKIAELSHRRWVDTDEVIVNRYGNISNIFERYGEAHFRALETETVRELSTQEGLVVSTGGGLVLKTENCALLKEKGKIFFLRASLETLENRVRDDESRPLLKEKDKLREKLSNLLKERTPVYERVANAIVDTDGKSVEQVAREILALAGEAKE